VEGTRRSSGFLAAFAAGPTDRDPRALLLGLAVLLPLLALDLVAGRDVALTSGFAVPPLVAAYASGLWGVSAVSLVSFSVALASPAWNTGFDDTHPIRMLVVVAGCGIAIFTAWIGLRARSTEVRMRILDAISDIANGTLPVAEALERLVEILVPEAGDFCMVDVIADGKATRVAARARGDEAAPRVERWLKGREPSLPPHMLTRDPTRVPEPSLRSPMDEREIAQVARSRAELELLRSIDVNSTIVVPLVARGRALGALQLVTAWSGRRYTPEDLRFAQILAARIGLALDNAGLFSDLESVERRLDAVMISLGEAVLVYDDRGAVVYANPAAATWLGYENQAQLVESDAAEVRERFRVFDESGRRIEDPVTELANPENLGEKRMLRVLAAEDRGERWARFTVEPIAGEVGGPLYAVLAIEDLTEVKRAEIAQRLLAETGEVLTEAADLGALQRVTELAVPEFADWCTVNVPEGEEIRMVAVSARDRGRLELARHLAEEYTPSRLEGPHAEVLDSGEARVVEVEGAVLSAIARDDRHRELLASAGARSAIFVPLAAGTKLLGTMMFVNAEGSRRFDGDDLAVAVEVGRRAGQAMETARLVREIANVAATLQTELMPSRLPEIAGWSTSTLYRPAGEVSYVGGDFYDAFDVPGGWMIVMGDVVGRGPAAASLTAIARDTLRSVGKRSGDAAQALGTLDHVLRTRERPGICSAVVVRLPELAQERLSVEITSAGHPLPLHIDGAGVVSEVGAFGPLLGAFDQSSWTAVALEMRAGEQLVLYTDGVTESKRATGDRFGDSRLQSELAGLHTPAAVIARIGDALSRFGAQPGIDDVASVAIALNGAVDAGAEGPASAAAPGRPARSPG
jgi:PAS domain S-box-containing protein